DRGGETLAVGCNDGTAHLWDLATRRRLAGPLGHLGFVKGVAFRPDGKALLTASFDGHARLWDLARLGRPAAPLLTGVFAIRPWISPDGRLLLVGDARSWEASLWEIDPGPGPARAVTARRRLGLKPPEDEPKVVGGDPGGRPSLDSAAFRPDGRLAATAGPDPGGRVGPSGSPGSVVRIWEVESGRPFGTPLRFAERIQSLAFLPDGALVTAGDDGIAQVWDPATGRPLGPPLSHGDEVTAVAVNP